MPHQTAVWQLLSFSRSVGGIVWNLLAWLLGLRPVLSRLFGG